MSAGWGLRPAAVVLKFKSPVLGSKCLWSLLSISIYPTWDLGKMKALLTTRDKRECINALTWPCCVPILEEKEKFALARHPTGSQEDHHITMLDFPCSPVVETPSAKAGDTGSIPGLGRSRMPQSTWTRAPQLLRLCSSMGAAEARRSPWAAIRVSPAFSRESWSSNEDPAQP